MLAWLAFALAAAAPTAAQTTIALKTSIRADPAAQQLRLMDVAALQGEQADNLGDVVVVPDIAAAHAAAANPGWFELTLDSVRDALDQQNVNWAKVILRGGKCTIRVADAKVPLQQRQEPRPRARHANVELDGPSTIKTCIARRLAALYGVEAGDLKLSFNSEDSETLAILTGGRQVEVNPTGTAATSRMPIGVSVYSGDQIVLSRSLMVDVLVRREVVTLGTEVTRGTTLAESTLSSAEQWVAPSSRTPLRMDQAVGSKTLAKMAAGQVVYAGDVQSPLACQRGDTVVVHCISGSVVVKMRAKALGSARDGEIVQLTVEGSRTPISARMNGQHQAVLSSAGSGGGTNTAEKGGRR